MTITVQATFDLSAYHSDQISRRSSRFSTVPNEIFSAMKVYKHATYHIAQGSSVSILPPVVSASSDDSLILVQAVGSCTIGWGAHSVAICGPETAPGVFVLTPGATASFTLTAGGASGDILSAQVFWGIY